MRAAFATSFNDADPLAGLTVGDAPEPTVPDGWAVVDVRATSLNHHDLWSLRGVGLSEDQLPMILGCDAAGIGPDGGDVVVYPVIVLPNGAWSILSEKYPGTVAERVAVPAANLVPKPAELTFAEAACLPTAWLTAYRMLTTKGRLADGDAVLVQGAGGGVATAVVVLGTALGARVYATSRDPGKRERIEALGAQAFEPGALRRGHRDRRRGHVRPLDEVGQDGRAHRGVRGDQRSPAGGQPAPGVRAAAGDPG
jgi:NADPH:quinone reductase-like Zn-dependent oxidoreductase